MTPYGENTRIIHSKALNRPAGYVSSSGFLLYSPCAALMSNAGKIIQFPHLFSGFKIFDVFSLPNLGNKIN